MGRIRVLPEHLTNKIAAGEVVERPSSVVKELVENALDAQASRISVGIRHGGKSFISVSDNGTGMDRADAELCIRSHTTSKIREIEDIFAIASLGFRGEALSSIASVSRLILRTRSQSEDTGTEIYLIGGRVESIREIAFPVGTTIEVADLFFNTPARKKFLKGEKEGIRKYDRGSFDVVITDYLMPELDGRGVLQHIRRSARGRTPIVGMSGTPWLLQESGFDLVLTKPFPLKQLVEAVQKLCAGLLVPEEASRPRVEAPAIHRVGL